MLIYVEYSFQYDNWWKHKKKFKMSFHEFSPIININNTNKIK